MDGEKCGGGESSFKPAPAESDVHNALPIFLGMEEEKEKPKIGMRSKSKQKSRMELQLKTHYPLGISRWRRRSFKENGGTSLCLPAPEGGNTFMEKYVRIEYFDILKYLLLNCVLKNSFQNHY